MLKENNRLLIDKYISELFTDEIFTNDMKPYMELLFYKKNEYICREGEEIGYLLFIVDGKAKVFTTVSNGKSLLLCFYPKTTILGDIEMVDDRAVATNVQVIEDTYCIVISRDNIKKHLLEDSKFLKYLCNSLGQKLHRSAKNSAINLLYPLEKRLSSYILAGGDLLDNGSRVLSVNENLIELSELLGTSYRHLHRTLKSLCEKGILKKTKNGYEVSDHEEISHLAADLYS